MADIQRPNDKTVALTASTPPLEPEKISKSRCPIEWDGRTDAPRWPEPDAASSHSA